MAIWAEAGTPKPPNATSAQRTARQVNAILLASGPVGGGLAMSIGRIAALAGRGVTSQGTAGG